MTGMGTPPDRTGEYRRRDLHAEGTWPPDDDRRYGAVVFDRQERVLLREPTNHYDGYHWTFPKGRPDPGEHPVDTALRETLEETGHRPHVVGHLPGAFRTGSGGSANYFYVMVDDHGLVDPEAMAANGETSAVRWATRDEARELISQTTKTKGRARDLRILEAAYALGSAAG